MSEVKAILTTNLLSLINKDNYYNLPSTLLNALHEVYLLILKTALWVKYEYYHLHFAGMVTEAQGGQATSQGHTASKQWSGHQIRAI